MIFEKLLGFLKIQKFQSELQLLDGTLIQIAGIFGDKDVPVNIITSDGLKPLPDGEYRLGGDYEGTIIIVEAGIITDVKKINEDEEPEPDQPEPDQQVEPTDMAPLDPADAGPVDGDPIDSPEDEPKPEVIAELTTKIDDILKRLEALETIDANTQEELSKMKTLLEKTDGAKPVKKNLKSESINESVVEVKSPYFKILQEKNKNKK